METKLPKEYEKEKEAIKEEYKEKGEKRFRKWIISMAAIYILAVSSVTISNIKSKNLEKNYLIYQAHIDNQKSLMYLNNKLNQHKPEEFPVFLSKPIKNQLENISVQEDSAKVSSLEKAIKIAEQENAGIINTTEFKEYSEKEEKIEKYNRFCLLGLMGLTFASLSTLFFTNQSSRRRKSNELKTLDKKYGLIPEES